MNKIPSESLVRSGHIIENIFGYWPSFHDAEIISFCIKREKTDSPSMTNATISIRHWGQDNPEFSGNEQDCIIEFLFRNLSDASIEFNDLPDAGWISEIIITKSSGGRIKFDVVPQSGFNIIFLCESIEVIGIYPVVTSSRRIIKP